ncbi:MAG: hypothetical protein ACI9DH_000918 [Halioglobus sp.]
MQDKKTELATADVLTQTSICRNCNSALTGSYCGRCGQKESNRNIHFFELLGEFVGDIFVWESGLWKTLIPLLIRPGFLSIEYFKGRKARYLPPLRLYLVISFLLFLLVSLTSGDSTIIINAERESQHSEQATTELEDVNRRVGTQAANLDFWEPDEKPEWALELEQRLNNNINSIEQDPDLFLDSFIERLPYLMFLLLPLFALLIKLSYLFSPFHYLQHLVFSLHYHSAIFLIFSFGMILDTLTGYEFGLWTFIWCFLYLPLALAKAYNSSYVSAFGKSLLIGAGEALLLVVALSSLAIVSVVTL